jgi:hypothetical protein
MAPKVKDWRKRNPGATTTHGYFEFQKPGLWDAWYNFPPARCWLEPEVYKRVRRIRIRYQTFWYVEKPDPYVMIDNKMAMKVSPPEAEIYTPTEIESDEELIGRLPAAKHTKITEADLIDSIESSDDECVLILVKKQTADPLPIRDRDGVHWQGEVERGSVSIMDVSLLR